MDQEDSRVFTARNGLRRDHYEICDDGLHIRTGNLLSQEEMKFPFDIIPTTPTTFTHRSKTGFWLMIVFVAIMVIVVVSTIIGEDVETAAYFIWGFLAVVCTAWYFLSVKNFIIYHCPNGGRFSIFYPNRKREEALAFASLIEETKQHYLEKKIEQYLPIMGRDGVNAHIIELRENTILNDKSYHRMMKKADEANTIGIVGFRKHTPDNSA